MVKQSDRTSSAGRPPVDPSRFKGVRKRSWGRWVSEIRVPHSRSKIWLGSYPTPEQAARAYDVAALLLRGSASASSFLNFSDSVSIAPASLQPGLFSPRTIQATAAALASSAPSSSPSSSFSTSSSSSSSSSSRSSYSPCPMSLEFSTSTVTTSPAPSSHHFLPSHPSLLSDPDFDPPHTPRSLALVQELLALLNSAPPPPPPPPPAVAPPPPPPAASASPSPPHLFPSFDHFQYPFDTLACDGFTAMSHAVTTLNNIDATDSHPSELSDLWTGDCWTV